MNGPPRSVAGPGSGVLAAVVFFNGQEHVRETLKALGAAAPWPCPVLAVDNASTDATEQLLLEVAHPHLELLALSANQGVAAAYNLALEEAKRRGVSWLFLLDQDSRCAPGCLERLYREGEVVLRSGQRVGALCPTIRSSRFPEVLHLPYTWDGRSLQPVEAFAEQGAVAVDSGMSSGTLYLVEALDSIGGFRQDFFIDFVDHECHLRLRRAGWSMLWIREADLAHELGCRQVMTSEGLWIEHEPFRYYYMARNMIAGYRMHGGYRAVFSFFKELRHHAGRLRRYGQSPASCCWYLFKGAIHGLLGRMGPMAARHGL